MKAILTMEVELLPAIYYPEKLEVPLSEAEMVSDLKMFFVFQNRGGCQVNSTCLQKFTINSIRTIRGFHGNPATRMEALEIEDNNSNGVS